MRKSQISTSRGALLPFRSSWPQRRLGM